MKKILKWIGIALGLLVVLALIVGVSLFTVGKSHVNKVYTAESSNLTLPTDAASVEYGKHRAETLCQGCHGPDLSGVDSWFNAPPIGLISSPNLTSGAGGIGASFTTEDYVRAIRHGIDPQGKAIFMPAVPSTSQLSDEDLASIIAYLKTIPPVDHTVTSRRFTSLGYILFGAGKFIMPAEIVSHAAHVTAPERGVSVEYGEYMVNTNDCRACHGEQLNGGSSPDPSETWVSPNLTPGGDLASWTEEGFIHALRTGSAPGGKQLADIMPWKTYKNFTDDELKAIWMYLQTVPPQTQFAP
ncbi:MAG: cytochrome c [Anaerolineales bacterium]|nr:cytochrome c [Anaerolineales bacterium]